MTNDNVKDNSAIKPTKNDLKETAKLLSHTFDEWDKSALIDYAVKVTDSLVEEQETIEKLTQRYDDTQSWAMELALVEEIGQSLASTLDFKTILTRLLRRVYNAIDVEDGSVLLIQEPSGDLVSQVVLGSIANDTEPFRIPKGQGIAGEVVLTGEPIIVNNAQQDDRHFKKIDQDTGFQTASILCVPLRTRDKIIGVLEVFNKKNGLFTKRDQILLSSIASYAAIAIENARLHEKVVSERDRVINAQEEVSRKLQRDLHDGPTQLVAAIQMGLDFCQKALKHNQMGMVISEIDNMYHLAQRASHQMRTLLFELRPLVLETRGLVMALTMFLERKQTDATKTKLHFNYKSDQANNKISRLENKSEAALFAIVQEAVNNALKHAQAKNIFVDLKQVENKLSLVIADDGEGFDVDNITKDYENRGSYGMVNLRERVAVTNGNYTIKSKIGQGTKIEINVPL